MFNTQLVLVKISASLRWFIVVTFQIKQNRFIRFINFMMQLLSYDGTNHLFFLLDDAAAIFNLAIRCEWKFFLFEFSSTTISFNSIFWRQILSSNRFETKRSNPKSWIVFRTVRLQTYFLDITFSSVTLVNYFFSNATDMILQLFVESQLWYPTFFHISFAWCKSNNWKSNLKFSFQISDIFLLLLLIFCVGCTHN